MSNKKQDKQPKAKGANKSGSEQRTAAREKLKNLAERIDSVNRKLFGGTNELLQNAGKGVRAADAYIEATADWTPQTKGKKALIPGQKVMLRPDLTDKEMKTYAWLDSIDVLNGAVIVVDTDERNVVVMRTDNVKTRILKRHLTAWFPVQKS